MLVKEVCAAGGGCGCHGGGGASDSGGEDASGMHARIHVHQSSLQADACLNDVLEQCTYKHFH